MSEDTNTHTDYNIVKLEIIDKYGNPITRPFKLKSGENVFRCLATYSDGSTENYAPYWTCPIVLNTRPPQFDVWGTFGSNKKAEVVINALPEHQRYTELACWVSPPKEETITRNSEIPHDSTGFDYSLIRKTE